MIPVLIYLLTVSIIGAVVYVYLRQEQDKIIIKDKKDEKFFYNIFQILKHPPIPLRAFYIVAGIHFLIVLLFYFLSGYFQLRLKDGGIFVMTTLFAPMFILYFFGFFSSSFSFPNLFLFLASSISYGIMGGFIMSKKTILRLTGIISVCGFIVAGFFIGFMALLGGN